MKRVPSFLGNCFNTLVSVVGVFIAFLFVAGCALVFACGTIYIILSVKSNIEMDQQCATVQANGGEFHRMDGDKFKAHCYAYWSKDN